MKTKELLERIFAIQVLLYNRLNRIETVLSRFDAEYFGQCEGNNYRENLADIGMSIVGINAALTAYSEPQRCVVRPAVPVAVLAVVPIPTLAKATPRGCEPLLPGSPPQAE